MLGNQMEGSDGISHHEFLPDPVPTGLYATHLFLWSCASCQDEECALQKDVWQQQHCWAG